MGCELVPGCGSCCCNTGAGAEVTDVPKPSRNPLNVGESFEDDPLADEDKGEGIHPDPVEAAKVLAAEVEAKVKADKVEAKVKADKVEADEIEAKKVEATKVQAIKDQAIKDQAIKDQVIKDQANKDQANKVQADKVQAYNALPESVKMGLDKAKKLIDDHVKLIPPLGRVISRMAPQEMPNMEDLKNVLKISKLHPSKVTIWGLCVLLSTRHWMHLAMRLWRQAQVVN
eukprot:gene15413-21497_t